MTDTARDAAIERDVAAKGDPAAGEDRNELGAKPVPKLLLSYAIPAVIAQMVSALYNIIDQFFIGQSVGELGNAATNVAFPLTMMCLALSLMSGIGGAANFNLNMGRGNSRDAAHYVGQAVSLMLGLGILLLIAVRTFLEPLMVFFGATERVLPYAMTFTSITTWGFPFLILMVGGTSIIRADGSPRFAMACTLSGAIINLILNPIFVFGFGWGIAGSGLATTIGQGVAGVMVLTYFARSFKTVKLHREDFVPLPRSIVRICSLGLSPFITQLLMMTLQIVLNNSLTFYGAMSEYGAETPLAVAGIAMKMNELAFAIVIGISQGMQPIMSYNYGARKYARVRQVYKIGVLAASCVNFIAFIFFHLFPEQIIMFFGQTDEPAIRFACEMFRIFLFFTFLNAAQPITANFFSSIGKPIKGVTLSLTRQGLFLIPLILILPHFMGIDGIVWAAPFADAMAFCVTMTLLSFEFKTMHRQEAELAAAAS